MKTSPCTAVVLFLTIFLPFTTAFPTPSPTLSNRATTTCLTNAQASSIVASYRTIIAKKGNVIAENDKLFGPSFTFVSDSFAELLGYPVNNSPQPPSQTYLTLCLARRPGPHPV